MEVYSIEVKYRYENSLGIFKENPIKTTNIPVPGQSKEDALKKFKEHFSFSGVEIIELNCEILGMEKENLWVKPMFCSEEFFEKEKERLKKMLFDKD